MLRKALLILSGNATSALVLLVRNLVIARLIGVEDYGIAATFAVAMAVVEMASALGLQQQIVQAKDGDDPALQAGLQGFQVLRGVISAAVLFAVAGPLARFLGIGEVAWAYQVLALVPLFNAFQHFDIHRLNRDMRFGPLILTGTIPALAALGVVWPLAHFLEDWRVMLWSLIVQAGLALVTSHVTAERRYSVSFDRKIMARSFKFGWPLLINGILLFLVFQGDKLIVGRQMGMASLAIFAMGMTLTLTPTLVFARTVQNLFLPRLSTPASQAAFERHAKMLLHIVGIAALLLAFVVLLVGAPVVEALLGDKYRALQPVLIWFAVVQSVRLLKTGPAIVALALGQTSNAMVANLFRVAALPFAWTVAQATQDIGAVLLVALLGEFVGLIASVVMMLWRADLPRTEIATTTFFTGFIVIACGIWSTVRLMDTGIASPELWIVAGVVIGIALIMIWISNRESRT